jgi:glycosyltransferase involved in cell wall biosynthesis
MTPPIGDRPLRVLLAYRSDVDVHGGAGAVMDGTARGLRAHGVELDVTHELRPALDTPYDLVHVFNVWWPHTALEQMQYLRAQGVPLVWQPIYLKLSEYACANLAARAIFAPERGEDERQQLLWAYVQGALQVNGVGRWAPNQAYPDLFRYLREMAHLADRICACSQHEIQALFQAAGLSSAPFSVIPHGVDSDVFAGASAEAFRAQLGFQDDFVLCVASVDGRKNQLFLAEALRGTGLKLVLVGPCYEPDYLVLIRQRGGDDVVYFDRLPRALVASAYAAARVHALPSYAEGSALATMEAAAAGCAVVVSNRSSEFEYYEDFALYCDPADPGAIRTSVLAAWNSRSAEPDRWRALARHMRAYTWERAGLATLDVYRRTLSSAPCRWSDHASSLSPRIVYADHLAA